MTRRTRANVSGLRFREFPYDGLLCRLLRLLIRYHYYRDIYSQSDREENEPFAARAWAAISPIPVPPPVTRPTKPLRENRLLALRSCVDAIDYSSRKREISTRNERERG